MSFVVAPDPGRRRSRRWGVRTRAAAASVLVSVALFLVAAVLLLGVLQVQLLDDGDAAARTRGDELVSELSDEAPADVPLSFLAPSRQLSVVQLVQNGVVVAASADAPDRPLVSTNTDSTRELAVVGAGDDVAKLRVITRQVASDDGPVLIIVATGQDVVTDVQARLAALLAIGLPLIALLTGAATYLLVGRALRPVERMRRRATDITSANLSDRLPVPRADDEIRRLAVTLNEMLGRVETGHAAQRRFVSDASHELRSPLATLATALELGVDRPELLDPEVIRTTLVPEADRMQRLVEDLLLLARADEHELPIRPVAVDLDDLVAAEADRLRGTTTVRVEVHPHPAQVVADPSQLTRLLRNLAENAVRHAAGLVVLRCSATADGGALLVVEDDGHGIAPEERERVFDRFVRLDQSRARAVGGSGLGLAIVREIVAAHGATVTLDEAPSGGARFTVALLEKPPAQRVSTSR